LNDEQDKTRHYWPDDRRNIDRLVYLLYGVCALLFIADFLYVKKVHFAFESWIGFYGWYGFCAYVFIVLSAKLWRRVVRRDEDYYERDAD
jgi:uncharacterized membrane protein